MILRYIDKKLSLISEEETFNPICVDFLEKSLTYRRKSMQKELLIKAVGLKKNKPLRIIDCTAGLGQDAFILASYGASISLFERSFIIFELLKDGLNRGKESLDIREIIARMQLIEGDFLKNKEAIKNQIWDVVYIDPMYPPRFKTALVKKEMRILKAVVGEDNDADLLLPFALSIAHKRVVVKRPLQAIYLNQMPPDMSLEGRSIRFDVYLISPKKI